MLSPATKGSSILYRRFVHPVLRGREDEIDEFIARTSDQGYTTVLTLGTKGLNYATAILMQTATKVRTTPTTSLVQFTFWIKFKALKSFIQLFCFTFPLILTPTNFDLPKKSLPSIVPHLRSIDQADTTLNSSTLQLNISDIKKEISSMDSMEEFYPEEPLRTVESCEEEKVSAVTRRKKRTVGIETRQMKTRSQCLKCNDSDVIDCSDWIFCDRMENCSPISPPQNVQIFFSNHVMSFFCIIVL